MAFGTIKALLFAAVASAAFSAQQSHAQRMTTMLPGTVKNFELPNIRDGLFVNAVINSIRNSQKSGQVQELNYSIFPLEGAKYLDYLVERANEEFKDKILAIYGMGSLGYGGYVEGWSDFDIDIIVDNIGYDEREKYFKIGKEIEKEIVKKGFERIDIRTYSLTHLNERKTISPYGECSRASMLRDSAKLIYGKDIRSGEADGRRLPHSPRSGCISEKRTAELPS